MEGNLCEERDPRQGEAIAPVPAAAAVPTMNPPDKLLRGPRPSPTPTRSPPHLAKHRWLPDLQDLLSCPSSAPSPAPPSSHPAPVQLVVKQNHQREVGGMGGTQAGLQAGSPRSWPGV